MADISIASTSTYLDQLDQNLLNKKIRADIDQRADTSARISRENYEDSLQRARDYDARQSRETATRLDDIDRVRNQVLNAELNRLQYNQIDANDYPEDLPRGSIIDIVV